MMSVFGISYCCSNCNDIELPFTNETIKQYNQRTVNIHPNKKIEDEDFEKLEIYYKKLRGKYHDLQNNSIQSFFHLNHYPGFVN
ncbi:Hypothetical protein CINCED_3A023873 [Cinara cedri]|uniref:DnaJ domain n=1 Tax=Cinara cedri TaxID=506608 RepID=A0A5E4MML3_9HEMI|nr:Hypothetical protein CINCED_3A023873 [Cinara cedri]